MRSLLIVAAHDEPAIEAALLSEADAVALALDVAPDAREAARSHAARVLAQPRARGRALTIRVSALASGETDRDLDAIMAHAPAAILLPRCAGGAEVQRLAAKLAVREAVHGLKDGGTRIVAMIETAEALVAMPSFRAASHRLLALAWDAESLRANVGAAAARDAAGAYAGVPRAARDLILAAAAAAGAAAIDTAAPLEADALRAEAVAAARVGFSGKVALAPAQAAIINAAFGRD